jgi:hypothetical protein
MLPPLGLIRSGMLMLWFVILALAALSAGEFPEVGVGCLNDRELFCRCGYSGAAAGQAAAAKAVDREVGGGVGRYDDAVVAAAAAVLFWVWV